MSTTRTLVTVVVALAIVHGGQLAHADQPVDDEIAELDAAIALHPADVSLLVARAEHQVRAQRPEAALPDLTVASALAPRDPRVPAVRAEALLALEQRDAALSELERAIDAGLASPRVLQLRARLLTDLGRAEEAIIAWDEALESDPDPDGYLERAALLASRGMDDAVLAGLREGLARTGATSLRVVLVERAQRIGRWDDALGALDPLLAQAQGSPHWHVVRGEILASAGRDREARREHEIALALLPPLLERRPTAASHTDHARALLGLGRVPEAEAACRRALARSPGHRPALETLARLRATRPVAAPRATGGGR